MISLAEQRAEAQRCSPQGVKRGQRDAGGATYESLCMEATVKTRR
jgi:hypothetical protein